MSYNSTSHATILYFNQPDPILAGSGNIFLEGGTGSQDVIAGMAGQGFTTVNLDNQGNVISGAGAIGQNDGALTFTNDTGGIINAVLSGQTLFVETGSTFTNNSLMEATNGGILVVGDGIGGTGSETVGHDAVVDFQSSVSAGQTIAYSDGTGILALSDASDFHASITELKLGDTIDLTNIAPADITSAMIEGSKLVVNEYQQHGADLQNRWLAVGQLL